MALSSKVCMGCGKTPEDTPEKFLYVILDERRLERGICVNCLAKKREME